MQLRYHNICNYNISLDAFPKETRVGGEGLSACDGPMYGITGNNSEKKVAKNILRGGPGSWPHCIKSGICVPINAWKSPEYSAVNDNLQPANIRFVCVTYLRKQTMMYVELPEVRTALKLHMNSSKTTPGQRMCGLASMFSFSIG